MQWKYLSSLVKLATVIVLLLIVAHVSVEATSGAWEVVPSPNGAFPNNILYDLDGTATNDVWAVGATGALALLQHWDGSSWNLVPAPDGAGTLRGVDALSASDAWAVGYAPVGGPDRQTQVLRWDGAAWTEVPAPNPGSLGGKLFDVAAASADDVWAVGNYVDVTETNNWQQTLILHWDGAGWSEVPSPNLGTEASLYGVTAVAPDDVWAVGFFREFHAQTLTLHWDGTAWNQVPSPNLGSVANSLNAVSATAGDDVWAVGTYDNFREPLILHWDGAAWSAAAGPRPNPDNVLLGVTAVSTTEAYGVGWTGYSFIDGGSTNEIFVEDTFVIAWDGSNWTQVASESPGERDPYSGKWNELHAVMAVGSDRWAAGFFYNMDTERSETLIERATGSAEPQPTPTPPPTSTPLPTPTPSPASTMHVADLDGSASSNNPHWEASVSVTVVDANGDPVSGAAVDGDWSAGTGGDSNCTTDGAGQCSVSRALQNRDKSVTYTVQQISHSSLTYDPAANADPDGDSDGSQITVQRP